MHSSSIAVSSSCDSLPSRHDWRALASRVGAEQAADVIGVVRETGAFEITPEMFWS